MHSRALYTRQQETVRGRPLHERLRELIRRPNVEVCYISSDRSKIIAGETVKAPCAKTVSPNATVETLAENAS